MVKVIAATVASLLGKGEEGGGPFIRNHFREDEIKSGHTKPQAIDCKSGKVAGHSHCRQGTAGPGRTP